MLLMIDDVRDIESGLIARTGELGLAVLEKLPITELWLDHDLGENGINGYEVLEKALEKGIVPDKVSLITSNPVGRSKMRLALENSGYKCGPSGSTFTKE